MAAENFSKCMVRVLAYEGGYSNHPKDPGGVTLEGVIQRVYDAYRTNKGLDTQTLTPSMRGTPEWIAERNDIYKRQYWNKIRGDSLPPGVDMVVFDGAVNSGPVQSIKWLQRALSLKTVDGMFGEATIEAVLAYQDYDQLVAGICSRRLAFLQQLSTWGTFGVGWGKRVSNVMATGQAWATGSVGPQPIKLAYPDGAHKAPETDLAEAPVPVGVATTGSTAGTVATGAVDQIQQASAALGPLADGLQVVKYIILAATLVVAGITIYGIYRNWKAAKARTGELTAAVPAEGT